jgi:hypothetical protein
MEKTNPTPAEQTRELLLQLLAAVNSEEEYRYVQKALARVTAAHGGAFPNHYKEVQTTWKTR